jgi:hypothetical protein
MTEKKHFEYEGPYIFSSPRVKMSIALNTLVNFHLSLKLSKLTNFSVVFLVMGFIC